MKLVAAICLLALLTFSYAKLEARAQPSAPPQKPPFSATFIQYQNGMETQSIADWTREIETMKSAGIDSIVLQWLGYDGAKFYEGQFNQMNEALLNYADRHGMSVYLGLWFGSEFWETAKTIDSEYFRVHANAQNAGKLVKETAGILQRLSGYTSHSSFKGWYIPQEVWNQDYTQDEQNRLKACLKRMCDLARGTHSGRILISPIFNPGLATTAQTTEVYKNVFSGTGITDVLVQDGAGAKQWDTEAKIRANIPRYLEAYKAAAHHAGAKFWCNIESLEGPENGPFFPTNFDRLKKQIEIETQYADADGALRPQIITFDFYHYMSPVHPGNTFTQRKALYDAYVQAFPNP